ncbi:zinc-binding alcohol dehydrogenase family protein [Microvirga sp. KLBC 81]|uniref:quinone oxidoreductase family protein n=1 Tax=Microvirga sp. KLBC 81 TaxID=1862707 RepID=UPI00140368DF|nr:zinc-binding alcohol dehydrogenase family protein [Microvirga sp. KLBC 81]
MKAAILREYGDPQVLDYGDLPTPEPKQGEVLVRVLAAGLNRLDHYLREGSVTRDLKLPHVLGSDAAGVVEAVGSGVAKFGPGDRVIPMPGYPLNPQEADFHPISAAPSYVIRGIAEWGSYAQYMVVPERWLLHDDTGLTPEEVATLPMAVVTGVRAVKVVGEVKAGDLVLVHAGASGTGSTNIQIARALGARVAATVRTPEKADLVRELGAEVVIALNDGDFVEAVRDWSEGRGVSTVIDNLGGKILTRSLDCLAPLGRLVSMGFVAGLEATIQIRPFFFAQKQIRGTLMGDVEDLEWGLEQVRQGKIRPILDRTFRLSDAAAAHTHLAAGTAGGSIVFLPWEA